MFEWANDNAPAITALATVFLVLITAVYVVVTYLLVREQRNQQQTPNVEYELDPEIRTEDTPRADLKVQNVGDGTACEVVFLQGPRVGIDVDMPALGERVTLLPGEHRVLKVRPAGGGAFANGDLPLVLAYMDTPRRRAMFEVLMLEFDRPPGRWTIRNIGSVKHSYTARQLKRLARRFWGRREALGIRWRMRGAALPALLLDEQIRTAIRQELDMALSDLVASAEQMKAMQARL